eukprot:3062761-Pyramimonas_sp.AAC.1
MAGICHRIIERRGGRAKKSRRVGDYNNVLEDCVIVSSCLRSSRGSGIHQSRCRVSIAPRLTSHPSRRRPGTLGWK